LVSMHILEKDPLQWINLNRAWTSERKQSLNIVGDQTLGGADGSQLRMKRWLSQRSVKSLKALDL
jgi:hypothetical protein